MRSNPAGAIVKYVEGLQLVGGDHDGAPFTLLGWERRFVRGAFGTPGPAALTVGRKNGKSALVGGIACAVVDPDGPLHGTRRHAICVASSFEQGAVIFDDVLAMLRTKYGDALDHRATWRVQDSANNKSIEHRPSGARVRCVGSDARRAHGQRPYLALLDEPAQWPRENGDRLYAAMRTAMAQGGKLIALGTRSDDPTHWFSKLLEGGSGYAQVHACEPDAALTIAATRAANPSYHHLPGLRALLREQLAEARVDPAALVRFRALHQNAGVADVERMALLDASQWLAVQDDAGEAQPAGMASWGLDLGTSHAMSAVAAYWPHTGRLDALAAFPHEPGLRERGLRAGVGGLYQEMHEAGELVLAGRRSVDLRQLLQVALDRFGPPAVLSCDRWREAELRDVLDEMAFPMAALEVRVPGFRDGAQDVRAFRRALADGDVRPVPNLLLTAAMREARLVVDPAGNAKLAKSSEGGRRDRAQDDAAAAAILAVATGTRGPVPLRSAQTRTG